MNEDKRPNRNYASFSTDRGAHQDEQWADCFYCYKVRQEGGEEGVLLDNGVYVIIDNSNIEYNIKSYELGL